MAQTFEEFLMWYHASNNPHTDDMLPELYADWMTKEVDIERLIELAELWHKQEMGARLQAVGAFTSSIKTLITLLKEAK